MLRSIFILLRGDRPSESHSDAIAALVNVAYSETTNAESFALLIVDSAMISGTSRSLSLYLLHA